jgi:TonB C terminal
VVRGSLEVIEFQPREVDWIAVAANHTRDVEDLWSRLRREYRRLTSVGVALTAVALHALVVIPAILSGGSGQPPAHRPDGGSDAALQWVMLGDSSSTVASPPPLSPPLLAVIHLTALPAVAQTAPFADREIAEHSKTGDQAGHSALYGRYVGQMHARIDRAWLRPRTAIGAPMFQCEVQIDQDRTGRVSDVALVHCNGDARWQLSLVRAVEAASPLPAPPSRAVFARHVLLEFRAMSYSPTRGALYQPAGVVWARAQADDTRQQSDDAFQALREAVRAPRSLRAVQLRIEGTKVEVEPDRQ